MEARLIVETNAGPVHAGYCRQKCGIETKVGGKGGFLLKRRRVVGSCAVGILARQGFEVVMPALPIQPR